MRRATGTGPPGKAAPRLGNRGGDIGSGGWGATDHRSYSRPAGVANAQRNPFIDLRGPLLADYYSVAGPAVIYARQHCLDMDDVLAHAGSIATAACRFDGWGYFTFDDQGEPSIIIEAYGEDDETTIDLVAWPISKPEKFATALGAATVLGHTRVINPASWAFGGALRVYRTPLEWLQADCQGVVILDHRLAPYVLREALGPLFAQDEAHARALKAMLCRPPVDPASILYPAIELETAA